MTSSAVSAAKYLKPSCPSAILPFILKKESNVSALNARAKAIQLSARRRPSCSATTCAYPKPDDAGICRNKDKIK